MSLAQALLKMEHESVKSTNKQWQAKWQPPSLSATSNALTLVIPHTETKESSTATSPVAEASCSDKIPATTELLASEDSSKFDMRKSGTERVGSSKISNQRIDTCKGGSVLPTLPKALSYSHSFDTFSEEGLTQESYEGLGLPDSVSISFDEKRKKGDHKKRSKVLAQDRGRKMVEDSFCNKSPTPRSDSKKLAQQESRVRSMTTNALMSLPKEEGKRSKRSKSTKRTEKLSKVDDLRELDLDLNAKVSLCVRPKGTEMLL
eukprot:TRINITY_DN6004_c0_g1_i1.p1 TRINITY_DN6004_c0_g1~~TRINITY_DN6004_c0_g1_i1.p1  ORF type:complete len:281 (-),score=49.81 TRINITY_DN6004_c0_g1_i1:253-1035(-)